MSRDSLTRRGFLLSSAAAASLLTATELFGEPDPAATKPSPALEKLAQNALTTAKKQGASYCDIRINRYRDQYSGYRLSPQRGGGKTDEVPFVTDQQSFGFGVRVIVNGQWGFAASPLVTPEEISRIAGEAVLVAKANSALQASPIELAPTNSYIDRWTSPHDVDPFSVSVSEKLELLHKATLTIKKNAKVMTAFGMLGFHAEDKYFASSEGSSIQQYIVQVYPFLSAVAVDFQSGISRTRSYQMPPLSTGWEHVPKLNIGENAARIAEESVEHLEAPPVNPGKKDLVLMPSNLYLTIHESIGHSTELDRALGYEANFAGTSFLTPEKMGNFRIGTDIVTIYGDRTTENGLATVKYDDDGVRSTRFPIIEKGIFAHYQTIRDQAHLIGERESRGCCYADSWSDVPFQRMPNVWLKPGPDDVTLDDLISGVDDGILIEGSGSWSIDQQRYNFQFGGDAFWQIKGGKKVGMLSRVAYQSRTPDFWHSCDGIAGRSFWQQFGAPNDGKGEPEQVNAVSHGCSPSRFRQINVLQTD
ncbi:MAG TPA: TldD/PmbA family protein [Bryobacteraceae bacterium]|jgi:TldD protein|nr:TldD/PmbA family protein [Bryobacteraceae bacterium]